MRDNYLTPVKSEKSHRDTRGKGRRDTGRVVDGDSGGSHDARMENRVHELEKTAGDVRERLVKIETSLAYVATAASVEKMSGDLRATIESTRSDLIKWFVATGLILAGLAFTAARYIH